MCDDGAPMHFFKNFTTIFFFVKRCLYRQFYADGSILGVIISIVLQRLRVMCSVMNVPHKIGGLSSSGVIC